MALTQEDLQAIGALLEPINNRLDGIDKRLDTMQADIEQIKEDTTITREAVNSLVEWTDEVSGVVEVRFPVKKKQA